MAHTDAGLGTVTKRWGVDRIVWYMCQRERGVPLGRAGRRCLIMRTGLYLHALLTGLILCQQADDTHTRTI